MGKKFPAPDFTPESAGVAFIKAFASSGVRAKDGVNMKENISKAVKEQKKVAINRGMTNL